MAATLPQVGAWPPPNGGNGVIRGVTRRRHAVSQLLIVQNPHRDRHERRRTANKTWAQRQVSRKNSPSRPLLTACAVQNSPCSLEMALFGAFCACWASFVPPGRWWSRAGRQISRTGCTNMVRLKPTTPLLALNKGPLKPAAPLRPKTAAKTPISHPQRRWQFQSHTDTSEQRRWQFQSHTDTSKQRRSRFQPAGPPHLQHPHGARGRARLRRP